TRTPWFMPARHAIGYNIPVIHHSIPHHRHGLVAVQNVLLRRVSTNFFEKAFPSDFNRKERREGAMGAKSQTKNFLFVAFVDYPWRHLWSH
ncbi:MAG: hypothetical protein D6748_05095, partial [Calditrichaeota bacterium]